MRRVGRQPLDLVGKRYEKLIAKSIAYHDKYNFWLCDCDCGKQTIIRSCAFGKTKSCGCLMVGNPRKKTHGMKGTRIYNIWRNMKDRCLRKKSRTYQFYGARGITVSQEWINFVNFYKDMGASYLVSVEMFGEKDTTLERIDNEKGYGVDNCKWATLLEQAQNRRPKKSKKRDAKCKLTA